MKCVWSTKGLRGLSAGLAGTGAMTAFIVVARHWLRPSGGSSIPDSGLGFQIPHRENDAITEAFGLSRTRSSRHRILVSSMGHLAFGASVGAGYDYVREQVHWLSKDAGIAFGLALWMVAAQGLAPAFGLSRNPRRSSRSVQVAGAIAHIIYGMTVETACRYWDKRFAVSSYSPGTTQHTSERAKA